MNSIIKISGAIGVITALVSMYIAWQHNSQCEIHCDESIYWGYLLSIGASWLFVTASIIFLSLLVIQKVKTHNKN